MLLARSTRLNRMEEAVLAQLLDPAVLERLDGIDHKPSQELAIATRLRKDGIEPALAAEMLLQAQLRQEAVAKFGPFAERMLFTRDGLAQATRLSVAAHHARRMLVGEPDIVGDLGCGLGADSMALAGMGGATRVEAIDADPVTAALAAYNLRSLDTVTVAQGTAEEADLDRFDAIWLDPARRTGDGRTTAARRLNDPEAFSPSLSWAFSTGTGWRAWASNWGRRWTTTSSRTGGKPSGCPSPVMSSRSRSTTGRSATVRDAAPW